MIIIVKPPDKDFLIHLVLEIANLKANLKNIDKIYRYKKYRHIRIEFSLIDILHWIVDYCNSYFKRFQVKGWNLDAY